MKDDCTYIAHFHRRKYPERYTVLPHYMFNTKGELSLDDIALCSGTVFDYLLNFRVDARQYSDLA